MKEHQVGEVRDLVTGYASFQPSGSQMGTVLSFPVFPEDIWQCFGILLDVTIVGGDCCWLERLLNILHCTGQPSTAKKYLAPRMSVGPLLGNRFSPDVESCLVALFFWAVFFSSVK